MDLVPGDGLGLEDALKQYEAEVVERGRGAVVESLRDAFSNMNLGNLRQSRLAKDSLEK